MKKNAPMIVSVICCVLLVISLFQVSSLRQEVFSLRSQINSDMDMISRSVSYIPEEIKLALEEEANLLAASGWEYGQIDVKNCAAEVVCTIVPKEYAPNITETTLIVNGQESSMTYGDGQYTASIALPLFEESRIEQVLFNDAGTIRTQSLDWHIAPRYEALLGSYAGMDGNAKGTPGQDAYTWDVDYSVHIDVQQKGRFSIQSIELVEMLDGKEIGRLPVDISEAGQHAYAEAAAKAGEAIPENAASSRAYYDGSAVFFYYLDKTYQIPNGSELIIYVDVVDGSGFRYRSFAEGIAISPDGEPNHDRTDELRMFTFAEPIWIFDETGDVIYTIEEEYFG